VTPALGAPSPNGVMSLLEEDDQVVLTGLAGGELSDHHDRPSGLQGFRWRTRRWIDSLQMR